MSAVRNITTAAVVVSRKEADEFMDVFEMLPTKAYKEHIIIQDGDARGIERVSAQVSTLFEECRAGPLECLKTYLMSDCSKIVMQYATSAIILQKGRFGIGRQKALAAEFFIPTSLFNGGQRISILSGAHDLGGYYNPKQHQKCEEMKGALIKQGCCILSREATSLRNDMWSVQLLVVDY